MEILYLKKNTINEMRISVNGLNSKMEGTEGKTVNQMIEQPDQKRKNRWQKIEQSHRELWYCKKRYNIRIIGVSERKEKEIKVENNPQRNNG